MFANKTHEQAHETLKDGKIEESILLYSAALEEYPNHCDILSDRGVAYLHKKDKENCFKDLNRAMELQPDYAYRYACRAFAKNNFGDIDGAVKDYERAVELDPTDAVAHNNLGLLLEQRGYQKEANERFERADALSKQEDNLLQTIDDLESDERQTEVRKIEEPKAEQTENVNQEDATNSTGKELKKVLTSKKQFGEFLRFIKNGFKIK